MFAEFLLSGAERGQIELVESVPVSRPDRVA
jgi:hypothetical protein